jgi:putative Holliday junction resolvase
MKKIIGIDFGTARIGVAISDERQFLARSLTTVATKKTLQDTATTLATELAKQPELETIVIGLPLLFSGKESPMCAQVRAFAKLLEALMPVPILFWDERLTTAQVERTLKEADMSRKKRAPLIDALSACAILQNYLDFRHAMDR